MSIKIEKLVHIVPVTTNSAYVTANKKNFLDGNNKIGASAGPVKGIRKGAESKVLMPNIIGVSADSPNFEKALSYYWDSIGVTIPKKGKSLQVGFEYDLDDYKATLPESEISKCKFKNDEDLAKFAEKQPEEKKYKYGKPINLENYVLYRHCLIYGEVANVEKDIAKAPGKIRFFIRDESVLKAKRDESRKLEVLADSKYAEIINKKDVIENILIAANRYNTDMDDLDKQLAVKAFAQSNRKEFLDLVDNGDLPIISKIETLIMNGIISRVPNTETIIDSNNDIIARDMNSAIVWFKDDKNAAKINKMVLKVKNVDNK